MKETFLILPYWLFKRKDLTQADRLVFGYHLSFAVSKQACFASNQSIAEALGLSEAQVKRSRLALQRKGYLEKIPNGEGSAYVVKPAAITPDNGKKSADKGGVRTDQIDPKGGSKRSKGRINLIQNADQNDPHIIIRYNNIITGGKAPPVFDPVFQKISKQFGQEIAEHYLPVCEDFLAAKGRTVKDFAAFVRNWIRKDQAEARGMFSGRQGKRDKSREALKQIFGDEKPTAKDLAIFE